MLRAHCIAAAGLVLPFQEESTEPRDRADAPGAVATAADEREPTPEELDAMFPWRTGEILLGNGMAKLHLPPEFRYLDPEPAKAVLEEVWGNPPGELTWGMVFPAELGPFHEGGWGVVLEYGDEGHVDDGEASSIDYDDLLAEMQADTRDANEERERAGFGAVELVAWAARPHYDAARHRLYWAKELRFAGEGSAVLNYDVRVLGREGVLSMNAVADLETLPEVERGMTALLGAVEFGKGNRYEDFDPSRDRLAAYGIGGLIAGKLALKAGLFKGLLAALLAAKKLVVVGVVALGAALAKLFKRKPAAAPEGPTVSE